jgi:hypothetical protein
MPRLKQRRSNIQYGGTKVSIRESVKEPFRPVRDESEIALALLNNCERITYMDIKSYGAVLFIVELPEERSSLVMVESQNKSSDNTQLAFIEARHIQANIGRGKRYKKVCMKIIISNPEVSISQSVRGPFYTDANKEYKEVTPEDIPEQEKHYQREIFEKLLCSSSVHGDIIPDGIGFNKMTAAGFSEIQFNTKITDDKGRIVIEWIKSTATRHNLNINVFFMDYLDNFIQFRVLLDDPLKKRMKSIVAIKTVASILVIICITGYYSKDIHPGNVMFNNPNPEKMDNIKIKLIDFGQVLQLFSNMPRSIVVKYKIISGMFDKQSQLFTSVTPNFQKLSTLYNQTFSKFLNKSQFILLSLDKQFKLIFRVIIFYMFILGVINAADHDNDTIRCEHFMMCIFNCKPNALSTFTNFLLNFCLDYDETLHKIHTEKLVDDDTLTFDEYKSKCDANIVTIRDYMTSMLTAPCSWWRADTKTLRGDILDDKELNDESRIYNSNRDAEKRFNSRNRFQEKVMYPGGQLKFFQNERLKKQLERIKSEPITAGSIKKNKHKSRHNRRSNHRNYRSRIRKHNRTSRK